MTTPLRIIPLGGLGEVGKNMTVYETAGELIVVDAGLAFPRDEHLGVDLPRPPRHRPDVEPAQLEQFGYLDQAVEVLDVGAGGHFGHYPAVGAMVLELRQNHGAQDAAVRGNDRCGRLIAARFNCEDPHFSR